MSTTTLTLDPIGLPWETLPADRRRMRIWMQVCGALAFCLGLVMPWLPLPELARTPAPMVTPAPIEISLEQPRRIPPPPPPPLPPAPKQTAPASPPALAQTRPEPVPKATPAPAPAPTVADARAAAASAGLLAASSALEGLRGAVDTRKLASRGNQPSGVGSAASVDRALLTSSHGTRSAGLNEGALSRATGGVELAGRATTRVGVPGGTGTGGGAGVSGGSATGSSAATDGSGVGTGQRSIEEIRRVFDANKGAIFAIYHRALRAAPGLRGQVVLELVIEPGGAVTDVRVVSSELPDPELLDRLMGRIKMFDFGAREVGRTRISYPVHFLPS